MGTFVVSDTRGADTRPLSELEKANLQIVLDYYRTTVEKPGYDSAKLFVNDDYQDHNAGAPDRGLEALHAYADGLLNEFAHIFVDVRQVIVDGAFVMLRIEGRLRPSDPTDMVMEIFRVRDGKVSEHWEIVGPNGARVLEEVASGQHL